MQIAKYFASIGFDVDTRGLKKVDKTLETLEKKLRKFSGFGNSLNFGIGNFTVDQRKLNLALGNALDIASQRVPFEISRFVVNDRALQAALLRASRRLPVPPNPPPIPPLPNPPPRPGPNPPDVRARRSTTVAGFGGGVNGILGAGLALGLGGYGLGALNQRNQQVVSAQLQSSAVVQQAGGTAQQGAESFQYLRSEGQRIGYNYLDASQDYNKLISGLTGSGVGLKESQKVFTGFSELARVNKLDKTTQNRLFRALSQVAGKGKLQAEELVGQIAESLPGGTALFARAYQLQLKETGKGRGDLTGQAAVQAIFAGTKKGIVSSDILTYAARLASEQANKGGALDAASTASQAEQARYQNSVNDLAVLASNSGVEEGFARIFRTLNAGLSESGGLVRTLSEQFNEATKFADDLLLFPQDFVRALDGRDSLASDWLGADKTKQLQQDWKDIKQIFTDISSIKFDFLPTLEATAKEIAGIFSAIAEFQKFKSGQLPTAETNNSSTQKANLFGFEYASPVAIVGDILNNTGFNLNKARERGRAVYEDVSSPYYGDAAGYDAQQADMERAAVEDRRLGITPTAAKDFAYEDPSSPYYKDVAGYNDQQAEMAKAAADDKAAGIVNNSQSNQIDIVVNVDGSTLVGLDPDAQAQAIGEAVANMFVQSFDQVNVQFPIKQ